MTRTIKALFLVPPLAPGDFATQTDAGLARCACERGEMALANQHALAVWDYLQGHGGYGLEFPLLAYLACVEVFRATGEAVLARKALDAGYAELISQAERISDPAWRSSYLENVWEHHTLAAMYEGS